MNGIDRSRWRLITTGVLSLCATLGMSATPASAFFADACGVVGGASLARAFKLEMADTDSKVIRGPGNSAGVVRDRCVASAWRGRQPKSPQQERGAERAGDAASLRIETWVADETVSAATWRDNFGLRVRELTAKARRSFQEGRELKLPTFGVERSLGLQRVRGELVKLRALWWSPTRASIVSMTLIESRRSPAVQSLKTVAARVVPEIR